MNKMLVELGARLRKADEMLSARPVSTPNELLTV
jgi:hypothetical protein